MTALFHFVVILMGQRLCLFISNAYVIKLAHRAIRFVRHSSVSFSHYWQRALVRFSFAWIWHRVWHLTIERLAADSDNNDDIIWVKIGKDMSRDIKLEIQYVHLVESSTDSRITHNTQIYLAQITSRFLIFTPKETPVVFHSILYQ